MLKDFLAGFIDLLLNKNVTTKCCAILLEKSHRVENFSCWSKLVLLELGSSLLMNGRRERLENSCLGSCWLWLREAGRASGDCLVAKQILAVARIAPSLWMAFYKAFLRVRKGYVCCLEKIKKYVAVKRYRVFSGFKHLFWALPWLQTFGSPKPGAISLSHRCWGEHRHGF